MKEIPYRAELKKLYDEKILRISLISFIEKSYISFIEKSYMSFIEKSYMSFIEKSYMSFKGTGLPIKAKKEYIL